jgi:AraC-like DNA-binding protein
VTDVRRLVQLRAAKDLLDRDFAGPLDLTALAARAGYSRFHFVRTFRDAYGDTPGRYLTRRRVERAQELLRTVNLTVTEVCVLVGFTSLSSFTRRFRELVGVSPSEYQRRAGRPPVPGCVLFMWGGGAAPGGLRNRGQAPS